MRNNTSTATILDISRRESRERIGERNISHIKGRRGKRGGRLRGKTGKLLGMEQQALRIVSWNTRSHDRRRTVIEKLLVTNQVVMMQETKRRTRPAYEENDFHVYFKPSLEGGNAKRGLLTIIRKPMQVSEVATPTNPWPVETQAISIMLDGEEYILVNLYAPCDSMATASAWKDVLNQLMALGRRVIINGDFNARSPLWLDTGSNTNGKALEEALSEIDGIMLNNDAPTRIADRATDTDSAIDLTFVSPDLTTSLGWKLLPLMGSDHRPVMTRIIRRRDKGQAKRRRSGVFRYTNRNDSIVSECRKQAKERRQQSTAKGTPDKPKWWNQEVEEAWDAKMKASKAYTQSKRARAEPSAVQEMRLNFNTATANFKNIAEQARQDVWDNFCTECDPSDLTIVSRFWNLAKQIKSKGTGGVSGPQQNTGENGEHLRTDHEKGEAFKARFVAQLQPDSEDKVNNAWVEADAHIANSTTTELPVTFEEIQRTLGRIAKDSTPGPDGVKYSDLKNLSDEGKEKMVTLINKALMEGEVPTDWRD